MVNIKLSWQNVFTLCNKLSTELSLQYESIKDFEIVTIARGGLIPATIIAHQLDIKNVHVVSNITYDIDEILDERIRLLFIDDILDTRATLEHIRESFFDYDTKYCFLTAKKQNLGFVNCNPGLTFFIARWVEDKWVEFPWEQKL